MPRPVGRPRKHEYQIDWKLQIDAPVAARVEQLLWDSALGKPRYGARNQLINELLREWLDRQDTALTGDV